MQTSRVFLALMLLSLPLASTARLTGQETGSTPDQVNKDARDLSNTITLHQTVRRVPIDVVVTDKQGNPVKGLTKEDFTVKEDKKPQTVLSFDYQDGSVVSYVPPKLPPLPANTFVNLPTQQERGPLYVLYYDMVNTPMDNQMSAHQQILDFIDKMKPGTRVALFGNMAGLHLVQGFTSDHEQLKRAMLYDGPGPHFPKVFVDGRNYGWQDAGASLQCLKFIAEYLGGIPGRKNLIWLSSVFPIPVGPTISGHNSNTAVAGGFSSSTPQYNDLTYLLSETIMASIRFSWCSRRSTRWPGAASATSLPAAITAIRRAGTGPFRTSRRCSTTTPSLPRPICSRSRLTGDPRWRDEAEATFAFLARTMTGARGGLLLVARRRDRRRGRGVLRLDPRRGQACARHGADSDAFAAGLWPDGGPNFEKRPPRPARAAAPPSRRRHSGPRPRTSRRGSRRSRARMLAGARSGPRRYATTRS